ncbi:MAG TPA: BadF/BadG/BcrA/BcrD ATPase family protein [Pyrinomonadaceae bacterium]|jgi:N-acetylglucosamine kinase-like BadF-type ATPase|nr:BadF/BadG/BcrA/BcrD ATPase family protein [Pyrinomonadaceae bacterium]
MAPAKRRKKQSTIFPQLYLGVDGGGTKTQVALLNESRTIVAEGSAGPSNPLRVGLETAVANIIKAINSAADSAGVSRGDIAAAVLGLAGVRRSDLKESVRRRFIELLKIHQTTVLTDADIALYATTFGKPGIVVIAGTGSVCLGINSKGERAISGGWGPLAGDEGGGVGIAQAALHAVAKASDGRGKPTKLSQSASEYFRAAGPENLIVAIYSPQVDNMRIAGFAKYVVEAAQDGDTVAQEIIEEAGYELGIAASAVIAKLGLEKERLPIGCVGSVFNAGEIIARPMLEVIRRTAKRAFLTEPKMSPAQAAAIMALEKSLAENNGAAK